MKHRSIKIDRLHKLKQATRIESLEARTLLANIGWTGGATGFWDESANWDLNRVPTAGDDVTIGSGSAVTIRASADTVASVTAGGSLTINETGSLQTTAASDFNGSVNLAGGLLILGAASTFDGAFNWSAGTLWAANSTANASVSFTSDAEKWLRFGTLFVTNATHTAGTLALDAQGQLVIDGIYQLQGTASIGTNAQAGGGSSDVILNGTLRKTGSGNSTIDLDGPLTLNDGATIDVQAGTLTVFDAGSSPVTGEVSFNAASGATLAFDDIDLTVDGTLRGTGGGRIEYNGRLTATNLGATLDFAEDLFHWVGGDFSSTTAIPLINTGEVVTSGSATKTFRSNGFTNRGTVTITETGDLVGGTPGGATVTNDQPASLTLSLTPGFRGVVS